jgi:hypothetical protein
VFGIALSSATFYQARARSKTETRAISISQLELSMANTIEGKNISSKNATKHGCCADSTLILKSENSEDFPSLEAAWFETYKPEPTIDELIDAMMPQPRRDNSLSQQS